MRHNSLTSDTSNRQRHRCIEHAKEYLQKGISVKIWLTYVRNKANFSNIKLGRTVYWLNYPGYKIFVEAKANGLLKK